jgi:hypothetical protein
LPQGNRFWVSLIGTLQRFLGRQLQLRQQHANRRDSQFDAKLALYQQRHDRARPQPKVQSVLARITSVDPAKHLSLLRCLRAVS